MMSTLVGEEAGADPSNPPKLHGRAFWQSIGSPRYILAPMVDQSEFAWRMLTRSFMDSSNTKDLLSYSPMLHSRLFNETEKYRNDHFQAKRGCLRTVPGHSSSVNDDESLFLDGNPSLDRPLFVQFCANDPDELLAAARRVEKYCDAVDLNLGCPQGIAKRGNYGAFLQEDQDLIARLISRLHSGLSVPVTAKMRILESKEATLAYAKRIVSAGASIITVHGRQRHQKGHNTGLADWSIIRFLRSHLPHDIVLFANGNILEHADLEECLSFTGADGIMSAEGNLSNPAIFATPPPADLNEREYWRGVKGQQGWRVDAVIRRYYDIIYKYILERKPPERRPLSLASDTPEQVSHLKSSDLDEPDNLGPPRKRQKKEKTEKISSPNLTAMQAHMFGLLRHLVSKFIPIRNKLASIRAGDMDEFEKILQMIEYIVWDGIRKYASSPSEFFHEKNDPATSTDCQPGTGGTEKIQSQLPSPRHPQSLPYWVCQPYVRPLPEQAFRSGALQLSKKEKARLGISEEGQFKTSGDKASSTPHTLGAHANKVNGQVDDQSNAVTLTEKVAG